MKEKLYKALRSKAKSERDEALAMLEVYFENPTINQNSEYILEEMNFALNKLTIAEYKLDTLRRHFDDTPPF